MAESKNLVSIDISKAFNLTVHQFRLLDQYFSSRTTYALKAKLLRQDLENIIDPESARALVRVAANLAMYSKDDQVERAIKRDEEITATPDFDEKLLIFKKIVSSETVSAVAKATFLPYQMHNAFSEISSIVDVRPIFSKDKSSVVGEIILPLLNITYFEKDDGQEHNISLALEGADLDRIIEALKELVAKVQAISNTTNRDPKPIVIAGESAL